MSIIYSYPEQGQLNADDMLIGTSAEKVGGKQKNITRNFTVQQIADFINQGTGFVDPVASDFQIPVFNQEGKKITGSIISQNIYPNGSAITIAGSLTVNNDLTASGNILLGSGSNSIVLQSPTTLGGPIKDSSNTLGVSNQILISNGLGNLVWQDYEAGLTYEGTWNASTNTPTLTSGQGVSGHFYIVNVAGNTNLDGNNEWHVGDWAVFFDAGGAGTAGWQKIDNTSVLTGSGTANTFAMWTATETLNDSLLSQDAGATKVIVDGLLEVKGDGTSQDGRIKLNCWNNNHGVTIQSPPHSAAQSWTWILPQTTGGANQVLTTDGGTPSQLSWTEVESNISIAGSGNTDVSTVKGLAGFSSDDFTVSSNGWVEAKDFNGSTPGYVPDATSATAGTFLKEDGTWSAIAPPTGIGSYTTGNGTILIPQTTSTQLAISDILASGSVYTFLSGLSLGDLVQITDGTVNGFFTLTAAGSGPNGWRFAYVSGEIPTNFSTATNAINLRNAAAGVVGNVTGAGTQNYVTKWSSGGTGIEDSTIFDNGTNVGIGTASPGAKLDVAGGADSIARILGTTSAARLDLQTNSYHKFIQVIESDGRFRLYNQTTGSEQLTILNGGNVGIGTSSPDAELEISKDSNDGTNAPVLRITNSSTTLADGANIGSVQFKNSDLSGAGNYIATIKGVANTSDERTAELAFMTADPSGGSEAMRINSSGNVGIGTTSPSEKLTVSGNSNITGKLAIGSTSSHPTYDFYNQNTSYFNGAVTLDSTFTQTGGGDSSFSGNVGIGTTSPNYRFAAYGSSTGSEIVASFGSANDQSEYTAIGLSGFISSNGANKAGLALKRTTLYGAGELHFLNNTNADNSDITLSDSKMMIDSSGNVGIGTSSPAVSLDISGTDAVQMPVGLTGDRPAGANGMLRYNSTNNGFEGYINGNWGDIGGGSSGGLIFRGTFDASNGSITGGGNLYTCPTGGPGGTVDIAVGDLYIVTTAGSFYCSGTSLNIGDEVICITAATAGNSSVTDWNAVASGGGGAVTGSGTTNYVPKFTGATVVGNSSIFNDASGNVGIGTTSPVEKLYVNSTSGDARIGLNAPTGSDTEIKFSNAGVVQYSIGHDDATDNFVIGTANVDTPKVSITSAGNVGIGTTSPDGLLHVSSSSGDTVVVIESDINNIDENDNPVLKFVQDGGNTVARAGLTGNPNSVFTGSLANSAYFGNDEAASVQLYTNLTARLTIESDGNVGIGTTNPERPLHVLSTATDNASTMLVQNGSTGDASIGFNISGKTYSMGIDNSDGGKFKLSYGAVGTNDRVVVDTSGNVGIGTDSPDAKLHVESSTTPLCLNRTGGSDFSTAFDDAYLKLHATSINNSTGVTGISMATSPVNNYGVSMNAWRFGSSGTPKFIIKMHDGTASGLDALTVTHTGKVGIGNDQPEVSLDLGSNTDAVALPAGDNTARSNIANPTSGMIRYNTTDDQFEGYSGVGAAGSWGALGGSSGAPTITKDLFQVTTAQSIFTLTVFPQGVNYVNIFIDGVYQNSGTYALNVGTGTVTLNTNAPVGTSVEIISTT